MPHTVLTAALEGDAIDCRMHSHAQCPSPSPCTVSVLHCFCAALFLCCTACPSKPYPYPNAPQVLAKAGLQFSSVRHTELLHYLKRGTARPPNLRLAYSPCCYPC